MEELENANPTMKNSGENPANPNSADVENPTIEPESSDFSQLFSENISEEAPVQEDLVQEEPIQQEEISSPAQSEPQEVQSELQEAQSESNNTETTTQVTDATNTETNVLNPEFTNNENDIQISEHAFDKQIANTSLDNHPNIQTPQVTAEQRKAAIEQQKLAWLKQHEKKARKSWFSSGILSWIILGLLAFFACSLFAREQVIYAMDYLQSLIPIDNITFLNKNINNQTIENAEDLSNIVQAEIIEEENIEEADDIQTYYDRVDEIISSENDPENKTEQLKNILSEVMEKEEPNEELTQYISQAIDNLAMDTEDPQNEPNEQNENTESEENTKDNTWDSEFSNETEEENENEFQEMWDNTDIEISSDSDLTETIEEQNIEPYTITHVNSEEEANWVLPAHCSDLTCYWEDQEFVECTSFRMIETLDENTARVSSRWGCKYKDPSELVYVQFN